MAVISGSIMTAILAGGLLASPWMNEGPLEGALPITRLLSLMFWMWLSSFLLLAIQFAVSMAFASFAVPIVIGVGGTFIAVVATSAQAGIYFPWLLPVNILASDSDRAIQAILTGSIGGLVVFVAAGYWLAQRDWK